MASTTNCNCGSAQPCNCGTCKPNILKTCTPGHFYRIECDAYQAMCIPKGFPFWVMAGGDCCEGLHIGNGGQGSDLDRVVQVSSLIESGDFDLTGCDIGINWDNICPSVGMATATQVETATMLLCTTGGVKKATFDDLLGSACYDIPFLPSNACGFVKLAFAEVDGCGKIFGYTDAANSFGRVYSISLHGGTHDLTLPAVPAAAGSGTEYYDWASFSADAADNTINASVSAKTKLIDDTITVPCDGTYLLRLTGTVNFDPGQDEGAGAASRVVFRINNEFEFSPAGLVSAFVPFTNFELGIERQARAAMTAGSNRIEAWIVASGQSGQEPAQLRVRSTEISPGIYSTSMNISVERV